MQLMLPRDTKIYILSPNYVEIAPAIRILKKGIFFSASTGTFHQTVPGKVCYPTL